MTRVRVAVALLLPRQVSDEIDGIRRAFGADPDYIPPHITLVPPVNLPEGEVGEALAVLRDAAASTPGPLAISLGPFDTFLPQNPVLYLRVGGQLDPLVALRAACLRPPLDRPDPRPYVPHVTVARGLRPDDDLVARRLLGRYDREIEIPALHLLVQVNEEARGRFWTTAADVPLGPRRIVGRGGLEVELTTGELVDPEARQLLAAHAAQPAVVPSPLRPLVVTARTNGAVVGLAAGNTGGRAAAIDVLVVDQEWRRRGIGSHLMAAVEHETAHRGAAVIEARSDLGPDVDALLEGRGWTKRPGPGGPRRWRALGPG